MHTHVEGPMSPMSRRQSVKKLETHNFPSPKCFLSRFFIKKQKERKKILALEMLWDRPFFLLECPKVKVSFLFTNFKVQMSRCQARNLCMGYSLLLLDAWGWWISMGRVLFKMACQPACLLKGSGDLDPDATILQGRNLSPEKWPSLDYCRPCVVWEEFGLLLE